MEIVLRKYFWILNLVTITLCAVFAAGAAGRLAESAISKMASKQVSIPMPPMDPTLATATQRDITKVLARNVFCSTCKPLVETKLQGAEPTADGEDAKPGAPVKTSLNLKLVATMISEDSKAYSYAAILNITDSKTSMFSIGTKVEGATITDIMERRVLLDNAGRAEYLDLLDVGPAQTATAAPSPPPRFSKYRMPRGMKGLEEVAKGIRKTGEGKYEIRRSALNKVLGNTTMLARSARIVPSVRNGKPNGFKLYAIRPGSLYSLLGMFNGDTISAINGHAITTPDKALEVYTKLRSASHLSITFNRRGKVLSHDYNIR